MATSTGIKSQSIKNLKGGISQQPHSLRFPDQGTTQINGWSSETEGLQKRPPLVFKKRIADAGHIGQRPLTHLMNRDQNERYYAIFTGDATTPIRVIDLNGNEIPVAIDAASKSYITSSNPRDQLRCITVADYTFVVNKSVVVKEGTAVTDGGTFTGDDVYHDCLIKVVGGQYGRTVKVRVNGHQVDYHCPPGIVPATYEQQNISQVIGNDGKPIQPPQYITSTVQKSDGSDIAAMMPGWTDAQFMIDNATNSSSDGKSVTINGVRYPDIGLVAKMKGANGFPNTWTIVSGPGWIHIKTPANEPITELRVDDGYANQIANAVVHQVTSVAKLPIEAPNGYKIQVTGDTTKSGDKYYVQYSALDKVWKECVGWNIIKGLDPTTMPHALVRKSDGTFIFAPIDGATDLSPSQKIGKWEERVAGDDDTNPQPSFIGSTFNDVFMFRNRLGLLAGENIILSRTSKYFNFYPASVANESDDDPIDVAVSHNRISILKYAVPFSEQLLLWSDQAQFVLAAEGILSAKTIELNLTTQFDVSDFARPFGLGQNVYFASPRSNFTSIMRYYSVQDVTAVKNAENTSAHVPSYIPNGVYSIFGTSSENFFTVLTERAENKIFIYKYLYQDEQLAQQSWSHWEFDPSIKIYASSAINSSLFVIYETDKDLCFGTIDFTQNVKDTTSEPYRTFLDHKIGYHIPSYAYDINTDKTAISVAGIYQETTFPHTMDLAVVRSDGFIQKLSSDVDWGKQALYLDGDWSDEDVTVGFTYKFTYTFSQFLIKKQADDGTMTSEDVGRLQLRRAWVNYKDSGAFSIFVIVGNREPYEYKMSGNIVNAYDAVLGQLTMPTGQFRFPCQGSATQTEVSIVSETPNPLAIIGCGWEGVHVRRSSGI